MGAALTVYKASAGSGKTFTLTSEYVALLLSGEPLAHRNILAVTFTNKATGEMKARILQELWDIANGTKETGFLKAVMGHMDGVSATAVRQRARTALHGIIHDYDYFSIKTIDSFFQSLLSTLAHELGLAATFRVEINDGQVIGEAVDKLLKSLDSKPQLVSKLLHYIQDRIDDNQNWDFTKEVKTLAYLIMKDKFMENEDVLIPILEDEEGMRRYKQELYRLEAEAKETIEEAIDDFKATIESLGDPKRFSNYNYVEAYLGNLTKKINKLQTQAIKDRINDPSKWIKAADKRAGRYQEEAEILSRALEDLENVHLKTLSVINSSELTMAFLNPLQIIGDIDEKVREINEANNRFMLAKTPLLFDKMVQGEDASFVFEKAGTTFHHIMIDEFQDTSPIQWRNFYRLLLENMAQGNTCLLVGDVKQGIYRFRGGDWKILSSFDGKKGKHPVDIKTLSTNFRSARNIIDFNNMVFREIAEAIKDAADDAELADIYSDVKQESNGRAGGYVEIHFDLTKKKEKGAQKVAETEENIDDEVGDVPQQLAEKITELHAAGVPYAGMAILVRRNKEISSLLETFLTKYPDIPLLSDEAFHLSSSSAVLTIIYAIKVIMTGARLPRPDAVSMAYLAHACNWRHGNGQTATNVEINPSEVIPEEFLQNLKQLAQMPLYALCEKIINLFGLMDGEQDAPYIYFFLDEVLNYLESGSTDISDFLDFWDTSLKQKTIPASKVNGVRVLTIHKAKGLAYDTVFMPFCNWPYQKGGSTNLSWCEPPSPPYNYLPLLPVKCSGKMAYSVYSDIYEREQKDTRTENINMMYVAFTRARSNLYVWAKAAEDANMASYSARMGDYLYHVLQNVDYSYGIPPTECSHKNMKEEVNTDDHSDNPLTAEVAPEYVLPVSYPIQAEFRQSNSAGEFISDDNDTETKVKTYIDRGKLLHSIFSKIYTIDDIDNAINELWVTGKLSDRKEMQEMRDFISEKIEAPLPKNWFCGDWNVCNERNILCREKDGTMLVRRPDRVMTKGDEMVVVDFKFGAERAEHSRQVSEYCCLLRKMGRANVKGYLWYVFSDNIIEI